MTNTPNDPGERPQNEADAELEPIEPEPSDSLTTPSQGMSGEIAGMDGNLAPPSNRRDDQPPSDGDPMPEDDDELDRPADFAAPGGWDDRQEDGVPGAPRETPEEYVARETEAERPER
jgi:hypothetical protein